MHRQLLLAFALFPLHPLGHQLKVDLQWSICEINPQIALQKLGDNGTREPDKNAPVTYYDTEPPSYIWSGLMFRTKTRRDEQLSVVKAHFDPRALDIPHKLFRGKGAHVKSPVSNTSEEFLCVWDRYGNDVSFTCQIQSPLAGRKELWTDDQIRFAGLFQTVAWRDLVSFGPNSNPKWHLNVTGYKAVFDDVQTGHLHLMELEVKVLMHEGDKAYEMITRHLKERGIVLCSKQQPKTERLFQAMGYDKMGCLDGLVDWSG
ncbi:hypothetical protein B0T10DRAFT_571572 [Thelonectria olida]|uniref:Uncharacterized protein n=1 Tax=Thelonectria olida TaxID=1576542 RepID=A0A9P8W6Y7_9HYPO|nr:hypothetical protein B0T10DRAFT_571572 [Thelonectria olida]